MTSHSKSKGRFLLLTAAICWGLAGVCVKSITWNGLPIVAVRNAISLIMLLIVKRSFKIRFTKANVIGGIFVSMCGISYLIAIKLTTAGTAIVLQYIAPVLVFLHEVIFRGRKPKLWQIILTACVFIGIAFSFSDNLDISHVLGNILAIFSGFCFAGQILIMNNSCSNSDDCAIIANMISFCIGLPFLLTDTSVSFTLPNIIWLLILGIFQYGMANICFSKGCKLVDPIECSILISVEPIFNPIPVAIFCNEIMGPRAIIGAVFVIVSVVLYSIIPELEKRKRLTKTTIS